MHRHKDLRIDMPTNVRFILDTLSDHNKPTHIVGGCVRDAIMGITPKDWDICTLADPSEIKHYLKPGIYKYDDTEIHIKNIIDTGIKFGTVTFNINDELYEITTFRKETGYSDNRHPDEIIFANNLLDDLKRRDFTCNSMAYNDFDGLIDPFHGYEHIHGGILCATGSANDRFAEDALRILRAIRFATKYNWQITADIHTAILSHYKLLSNISKERIRDELCKILSGKIYKRILFQYSDVIAYIIPEFEKCIGFDQCNPYHEFDVYGHILETLMHCPSNDLITKIALFLHDIGKPDRAVKDEKDPTRLHFYGHNETSAIIAEHILTDLKFDNDTKYKVTELISHHDVQFTPTKRFIRKWLNKIGIDQFERLLDIRRADIKGQRKEFYNERLNKVNTVKQLYIEMMKEEQCFKLSDLKINGNDLILLGIKKGPNIGKVLNELLDKVIDEELNNTHESLKDYVIDNYL